jgi:cytochrome c553
MRSRLLLALGLALLVGCGGGDEPDGRGAEVFASAGCANCHTFEPAEAKGTVGPNLDRAHVTAVDVEAKVRGGGGGMPSFAQSLDDREIREVAAFVAGGAAMRGNAVVGPFEPDEQELGGCSDVDCRRQAFGNVAYREGPQAALDRFEAEQRSDPAVESDCHRIGHTIGAASLEHFEGRVAEALAAGRATCWSGYYHGVVEHAFQGSERHELPAKARSICVGDAVRRTGHVAYQCVHGLGHGLMIHTGYDLPESLRVCDTLETAWDQTSCHAGVFMENVSSSYGVKSRWLRDDDLIYPCNVVEPQHKLYCYLMLTSRILGANGYDWRKTVATCRESEPEWVATCFQSLGRDASGNTRQDADGILDICRLGGDDARECIYGAARDIVSNDAGPRRAVALCRGAPAATRAYCYEGIGTILGGLHVYRDERRAACRAVTREYFDACVRGAAAS